MVYFLFIDDVAIAAKIHDVFFDHAKKEEESMQFEMMLNERTMEILRVMHTNRHNYVPNIEMHYLFLNSTAHTSWRSPSSIAPTS